MTIEDVIACLDAFLPGEESENIDRLYQCLEPLATHAPAARLPAVPAMLRLIERSADAEFGSPGPLVHELESIPGYEPLLLESLQRQPEGLTVWMANRILNAELVPDMRARLLAILTGVLRHPNASNGTKEAAAEFLDFQSSRMSCGPSYQCQEGPLRVECSLSQPTNVFELTTCYAYPTGRFGHKQL